MSGNLNISEVFAVVFAATQRFLQIKIKTFPLSPYHLKSVRIDTEIENLKVIHFKKAETTNRKKSRLAQMNTLR